METSIDPRRNPIPATLSARPITRRDEAAEPPSGMAELLAELTVGAQVIFDGPSDRCPCRQQQATAA